MTKYVQDDAMSAEKSVVIINTSHFYGFVLHEGAEEMVMERESSHP